MEIMLKRLAFCAGARVCVAGGESGCADRGGGSAVGAAAGAATMGNARGCCISFHALLRSCPACGGAFMKRSGSGGRT